MPETPGDVIPEAEMNRRRRVMELRDDIADLAKDAIERLDEMINHGLAMEDLFELFVPVVKDMPKGSEKLAAIYAAFKKRWFDGTPDDVAVKNFGTYFAEHLREERPDPIGQVIGRMLAESDPGKDQKPAIEVALMFRSGGAVQGVLSLDETGAFKMLVPVDPATKQQLGIRDQAFVEHFFCLDDIERVAVVRTVKVDGPRIVT